VKEKAVIKVKRNPGCGIIKQDGQYKYKRKIQAHSCNRCFRGKAKSIAYLEYVFVALGIEHAMRMHHIAICGLYGSTVFLRISHKRHDFRKKLYY
jgi:hypothetical protein